MSRRALADRNAQVVKDVIEKTLDNNPNAWYFVITNPADAMATLANKVAQGKRTIIGTGTNLETVRFKTILSRELNVPLSMLEAYTGGEHGEDAVLLWSTVKINGMPLEEYLGKTGKTINKNKCENYVKEVSSQVIKSLGGTRFGPAGSFIEVLRGILLNTGKVMSYGRIRKFDTVPEPVYITVPAIASRSLGPDIWDFLTEKEHKAIESAADAVYKAYGEAKKAAGLIL
jgi:malate dehydrogenase